MGNETAPIPVGVPAVVAGGWAVGTALAVAYGAGMLDIPSVAVGLGLYVLAGVILATRIARFHGLPRFGLANILTLLRLVITCVLAAFAMEAARDAVANPILRTLFGLTAGALVLDGLDGLAARRLGLVSPFGARFDMETDALMILVLSVFAAVLGKAGPWVLASGLLRYVYVFAALFVPALMRPLAPAVRRKVIAAIQGAALALMVNPVIQPPLSTVLAAGALALLVYSFSADIVAQVRRP